MEIMKNAAADANKNYNFANQKKLEQLHAGPSTMTGTFQQNQQQTQGLAQTKFSGGGFALNFNNQNYD